MCTAKLQAAPACMRQSTLATPLLPRASPTGRGPAFLAALPTRCLAVTQLHPAHPPSNPAEPGQVVHMHFSPPCQALSSVNSNRSVAQARAELWEHINAVRPESFPQCRSALLPQLELAPGGQLRGQHASGMNTALNDAQLTAGSIGCIPADCSGHQVLEASQRQPGGGGAGKPRRCRLCTFVAILALACVHIGWLASVGPEPV